ncbi:uncharacterized protein THITE_2050573 [Thermothielavioides terrestris NRRL 8126]|uniref:FAD/NAD(P)-binding domain-containing protein n=1 Tax=Thermothielavioides terrestris (strain ATCC 38088 / NRRL 8126) TaxID=578455 RepID=G2R771_THETT|nr:uncharacterized protein THITE_2050573 [Thermothielavioides terrestris NRRL 8126]AEO67780.1 hypothetical protein THITE_2050573 [Thermothielavioides terrestris NRRL 8126]
MRNQPIYANRHMRVVCIGAGASGLYMAYKLKHYFTDFTLNIYEKNPQISGTWFENRYPGCACDVPAHNYTYSFEPKWDWSANYASSREIYTYFNDFADKYGLREHIHCEHEVVGARWDEDNTELQQRCDFLINASGILNNWRWPAIPGLHSFKGELLHSAAWDDTVQLAGKRVGLIGNGSSGVQILPEIQPVAAHLTTFIREPTWVCPTRGMEYHKYTDEEKQRFRDEPGVLLNVRKKKEETLARFFSVFVTGSAAQTMAVDYMREQMKQKIGDAELAQKLIPNFSIGCRRLTPGPNYLESLTLPNVTVVHGEIKEITPDACITEDGRTWPLDVLICATGFDTTFQPRFPVIGRGGKSLAAEWASEPRSYMGLAAHGFPNYFMFLGPNCPIANGPIIFAIELQGEYFARFLNRWQKEGLASIDPRREAVDDFMAQKDAFMESSVWASGCQSWYKDRKTGKVTALWPGSTPHYMEALASPRYDDFEIKYHGNRFAYLGNGFSQTELNPDLDVTYYIREKDGGEPLFRSLQSTFNAKSLGDLLQAPPDLAI